MADLFYYPQKTTRSATAGTNLNHLGVSRGGTSRRCSVKRQRRARTLFTEDAVDRLEAVFVLDPYPDINLRENLAEDIGVSEARIQTWFQNKRSRTRRMMAESSRDTSPPSAPSPAHLETPRPTPRRRLSPPAPRAPSALPTPHSRSTPTVTPPTGGRTRRKAQEEGSRQGYKVVKLTDFTADSGNLVIDFSVRSDTDTEGSPTSTPPGGPQLNSPAPSCGSPHPDAHRPFFTPWATSTRTTSPGTLPSTSLRMLPSHTGFLNPWMYGYAPSFGQGALYLQHLPSSPFLQHVADTSLPVSPGLSPLSLGPLSASHLRPSLRTQPTFFFPDVLPWNPPAASPTGPAPSDLDSVSSGYSSRDSDCHSPINVCD